MKYLDAGAYGLIIPMIETKADAERVVWAARYSPLGMRSIGPAPAGAPNAPGTDVAARPAPTTTRKESH